MTNTAIWKNLSVTDPKYTKKVNVGGGFTSINAQWQIQRMTEQFGPVGRGWGYTVHHSIERISDEYVLAVADVLVWWRSGDEPDAPHIANQYGPVRGMSPIIDKSKNGYLMKDDDAGKKAATDALTKALSHLGLSADVFLGLYDDNKYVREASKHFAEQHDNDGPGSSWGAGGKQSAVDEAERDGLRANAPAEKDSEIRKRKEQAARTKAKVQDALDTFAMVGQSADILRAYWNANKVAFGWIKDNFPDDYARLDQAYTDALSAASDRAA
jgi:hypothetical protein